jgi:ABC-type dipeptide/oligopeptide/nickel transport system permease subunit
MAVTALVIASGVAGFIVSYLTGKYENGMLETQHLIMLVPVTLSLFAISYASKMINRHILALEAMEETDSIQPIE